MRKLFLIILSIGFINNCTHQPLDITEELENTEDLVDEVLEVNDLVIKNQGELKKTELSDEEKLNQSLNLGDYEDKQEVQKWIQYFKTNGRRHFTDYLNKGSYYKAMVQTILNKHEVPSYFYYLAMIESGYSPRVTSKAKAVGIWQFIPPTGRRYGLRIDGYVDERVDPIRSSIAASQYLSDLHNVFHSWLLAMAAYNAGESRIMNIIMKHGTRDYWELVHKKALPKETRNYIPKFMAAVLIGNHPEKYGFEVTNKEQMPALISTPAPSPVKLESIAQKLNYPIDQLKSFNPHIKLGVTTPYVNSYRVWLTKEEENHEGYESLLEELPPIKVKNAGKHYYQIRKGDSLISIAKKFRTSVRNLKSLNGIRSNRIVAGRKLMVSLPPYKRQVKSHKVKKGETLDLLARRYGTTVRKIKKTNTLKGSLIFPGQVLKL